MTTISSKFSHYLKLFLPKHTKIGSNTLKNVEKRMTLPISSRPISNQCTIVPAAKGVASSASTARQVLFPWAIGLVGFGIAVHSKESKCNSDEALDSYIKDLQKLKSFHTYLDTICEKGGKTISFISASRPIGKDATQYENNEFEFDTQLIVHDICVKYPELVQSQQPLVIINGGAGRPKSGMDSINDISAELRKKGYNVKQIYCDITSGFPDEKLPDPSVKVLKMGFDLRQLAVISAKEVYVLPGGLGTNYELFQLLTIQQLKKFGIDVTSTGLEFHHDHITLVSNSNLFESLKTHLEMQIRLSLVSEAELDNVRILTQRGNVKLFQK